MMTTTDRPNTSFSVWHSLKTRVTILTVVLFLSSIWLLAYYSSHLLHNHIEKLLSEQQFSTTSIIADDINREMNDRLRSLETTAGRITPAILNNAASLQKYLEERQLLQRLFSTGILAARLDGKVIADTQLSLGRIGLDYSDREWMIKALKGQSLISDPLIGKKQQVPLFAIATPIRDGKGKVIGILWGGINLDQENFLNKITNNSYGKKGAYLLINKKTRTIVYATDKKRIMEVLPGPGKIPMIDRYIRGYEGSAILINPLGVEVLSSVKSIPVTDWYLAAMLPTKEAFAPIYALQQRLLLSTILLSLLAAGLTWWILRRQLAPISDAVKILAALPETSQYAPSLPIRRPDEIGELIGSFNRLLGNLKDRDAALRKTEERYRAIFTGAGDGIVIMSGDGNLVEVNESFARMHGYSTQEMQHMNLKDLDTPETFQLTPERMERVFAGEILIFEVEHYHKDGHVFPLEVSASLISYGKESFSCVQSFHRDITDRKQAEQERKSLEERLNHAEKMEALGQLAGGVAHDLNNVLGVTTIYSELLQENIPEESPLRKYADGILASTQKGAAIIEDLLTLARRGVTAAHVINLNSIVSTFLKTPVFEKLQSDHPNVTFRVECQDDLLNIKGSPVHLEKTLMNLVSNAAEAIGNEGEVTIHLENRYLDTPVKGYDHVRQGDYVVLTVSDTGMGIPAENIGKIFEPFYTKKTMGRSGTGLGLAIVWGTVKDHNGYIDLLTEVGRGTTFTLYFPVTRQELIAQPQKVPIEQYMGRGESVLVVDDIAEQREIASRLLNRLGYEVHVVSKGEEAVEYLKEHKADILVLDMIMAPGIDGLETYQKVLDINPKQKAILVSGFSETERVKEAQKLGAGTYVKKPYMMEKIGGAIRDELNRK